MKVYKGMLDKKFENKDFTAYEIDIDRLDNISEEEKEQIKKEYNNNKFMDVSFVLFSGKKMATVTLRFLINDDLRLEDFANNLGDLFMGMVANPKWVKGDHEVDKKLIDILKDYGWL